jgi:hypothetical protein
VRINQFPISETTLRQWDASTLEDLHTPPLPSDVPNSPSISVHPISWIPEAWPSSEDDLDHGGFVKEQPLIGPSPEISLIQDRSDLADDDDGTQAPQLLRFSGHKRKFVDSDGDLDRDVPSSKRTCLKSHTTIATKERSPGAHYTISASEERVHHITNSDLTLWPNSGCITVSCPALDVSVLSCPATPPSVNTSVSHSHSSGDPSLQNQSPFSSLQGAEIELSLPDSMTTSLAASSQLPNYSAPDARPQSAGSEAPFGPYVDNIPDSFSDSSLTSDDSSCGSWGYLETLEPESPTGAFVTLQDELFQIPNLDISNPSFILGLDPTSDVEINLTGHLQLERSRLSYESSETIFDKCKRKRLFIANEDEYEERPCKRRSIEQ